jgi:hypothetical protein
MYWLIGKRTDDNGDEVLFYEYFQVTLQPERMYSDIEVKIVAASSEETFLEYYQNNKKL